MCNQKLTIVSFGLQILFLLNMVFAPLKLIYFWWIMSGKSLGGAVNSHYLPAYPTLPLTFPWDLPFLQRFSAFCIELPVMFCDMLLMYFLFQLFRQYQKGEIFTLRCIQLIAAISYTYFSLQLIDILMRPLLVYVLTYHDNKSIGLYFTSTDINNMIVAVLIVVVSWVMQQGYQLKQENELTV